MKKLVILAVVVAVMASLVAGSVVMAAGKHGEAGKSNVGHLYLYEKNPADWSIVPGGAWGKMTYNLSGPTFDFVFNGHGLSPNTDYSLIYYADPWPGNNPGALIATGTSNADSDIHLAGSVALNMNLPWLPDQNLTDPTNPGGVDPWPSAKIWLVLSSDYNNGTASTGPMTGWTPTEYLFEHNGITYTYIP